MVATYSGIEFPVPSFQRNVNMGILRLFLALSVISGHATTTVFGVRGIGAYYAVNAFFVISGFYMAMVLNGKYKDLRPYAFYKSRALRLFPAYYIGLLLCILVTYPNLANFFPNLTLGSQIFYLFQNLFIVGQDLSYLVCSRQLDGSCAVSIGMTINPPAWSLAVEIGFYLIAPFMLKSTKRTFCFVLVGAVYLFSVSFLNFPIDLDGYLRSNELYGYVYYFYPSSFVFFGMGALGYHVSAQGFKAHYPAMLVLVMLLSFSQTVMPYWHLLTFSMAVPMLFRLTSNSRIDRMIGELSYPVYIVHFAVLLLITRNLGSVAWLTNYVTVGTIIATVSIALGWLVYFCVERKINFYRTSTEFLTRRKFFSAVTSVRLSRAAVALYFLVPVVVLTDVYTQQAKASGKFVVVAENITDDHWNAGILRTEPAFVVRGTARSIEAFAVGKKIKLADGEIRVVRLAQKLDSYLNVYLDGAPLDAEKVGFPHRIEPVP
jgi:peptidoglycan/LPS O-acetylase OafA/YrhL